MKEMLLNVSCNEQGQMIYKDDIIENSNMYDLLTWMIKLKLNLQIKIKQIKYHPL